MTSDACEPQTVTAPDGAQLRACLHGGHVLGWRPAGGAERLWLSPTARCGPGSAIRGGIPVVFPQFAARGPLPKHGFARDRAWQQVAAAPGSWAARLRDDDATRALWPHGFELLVTATATGDRLDVDLTVTNTGTTGWSFTAALHSYLAVGDPGCVIVGAGGLAAEDNASGGSPLTLGAEGENLLALTPRDVAVPGATAALALVDPALGTLTVTGQNFPDRVLWNPGPGHGLGDVPEGAEAGFVCVEPAALSPVALGPGQSWSARQTLSATA